MSPIRLGHPTMGTSREYCDSGKAASDVRRLAGSCDKRANVDRERTHSQQMNRAPLPLPALSAVRHYVLVGVPRAAYWALARYRAVQHGQSRLTSRVRIPSPTMHAFKPNPVWSFMRKLTAVLIGIAVAMILATPSYAAVPRPKPVTITGTSACPNSRWTITLDVKSAAARTADIYDNNDQFTNQLIASNVSFASNVSQRFVYQPGVFAQKDEVGVFPAGKGGWDHVDPIATARFLDPIQSNPYAGC